MGAILRPTHALFAAAVIGRKEIPGRLKHLLNVESGLNDGLALPLVLICLSVIGHHEAGYGGLALELFLGIAIGVVVPLLACWFRSSRFFGVAKPYGPLFAVAIGLLVLATASLKLATLLVFGALISPRLVVELHASDFLFAALALLLARPAAMLSALWKSELDWRERLAAGWFDPKGFASVVYGLVLFQRDVPNAERLFRLSALVIAGSIIAHSSTDVLLARGFVEKAEEGEPEEPSPTPPAQAME